MYYTHEAHERIVNTQPMCTAFPPCFAALSKDMVAYLEARDLSCQLADANGWYLSRSAGDTYPRIVIPAVTHKAGHVYWQARDVTGNAFIRYQSPKGPRHEALIKVKPADDLTEDPFGIVVVEGPMDALAAAEEGYVSYALMGMQPSKATLMHLALLIEDNRDLDILVLLDRDSGPNATKVMLFLASQGYHTGTGQLPGPEKDLAACPPSKREKFLSKSFRNLSLLRSSAQEIRTGQNA